MTEYEAYIWLGSSPCEGCSSCMVDEDLNFDYDISTKPRHYDNGNEMIETCQNSGVCLEYTNYMKEYNKLIK